MKSATDENGQVSTVYYTGTNFQKSADPNFWRPYAATDQAGNPTTFSYPSATAAESTMAFNNNNSVVDHRTTLDGFGRPIISQTEQGYNSSNYDSAETDYDVMGRASKVTQPYSGAAGATCSGTCPGTTTTYDALGRPSTVTDGGSGTITYTYTANDVYQEVGPAPSGESTKKKQLEYDALGRLISVCEITSSSGSGTCSQTSPQTGFWTQYTYDLLGNITGVTQNSQAASGSQQTRTYTSDMIGRLTSEANPETGTVNYTYDSSDTTCGSYASTGDLVEKKDAMNNYSCLKYDGLHRVTQITYPSGTYASSTPTKCFVYDSATINGSSMQNAKIRLAEAYTSTATSCPGTPTVDEGFSYSARGEVTDVWEKTPNSGSYYRVTSQYWASGAIKTLSSLPGLPTITYGASDGSGMDGEGRPTKVNAASGQNPVTAVGYNVASQVMGVTLGSLDNDGYQYDPSTGRMTQYTFNMGTGPQSQTGALTWSANGTFQQLTITDQINTANSQTCTFGYDDLVRITGTNCGSVWAQTFAVDPFGNLSKTGSASFLPTYTGTSGTSTTPSNQYYSIPGGSIGTSNYYDGNGNLKNDVTHTYSWDAEGNNLSVDGSTVTMIYDAMDRIIEQTRGSNHTQIVYAPYGMKLALMNGQTLVNAFVKLPGGARAVYSSSGLAYYRHADHLGSSRLSTTPARTKYYDVAYAPYGEDYNGSGTQDLAFTDQNQDTTGGGWTANLYDFLMRGYRTGHGRWISPDPAGLSAVNASDPQSWNRYAYVDNNPTGHVDAFGLLIADDCWWYGNCGNWSQGNQGYYGTGSSRCALDGVDVSCGSLSGLGSNAITICPISDCSPAQQPTSGTVGGDYMLVAAANGLVWINANNGSELTQAAATEAGLDQLNPSMIPGWNNNIGNWTSGALNRLKNAQCAKFFGGKGSSTMKSTQYLPFAGPTNTFAETYPGSRIVWVNTLSHIFQSLPGQMFFDAVRPGGVSAVDAGAYGFLHELSHQLTSVTGAANDGGKSPAAFGLNMWNTLRVMNACPGP